MKSIFLTTFLCLSFALTLVGQSLQSYTFDDVLKASKLTDYNGFDQFARGKGFVFAKAVGTRSDWVGEEMVRGTEYIMKRYYYVKYNSNDEIIGQMILWVGKKGLNSITFEGSRNIVGELSKSAEKQGFKMIGTETTYGIYSINYETTKYKLGLFEGGRFSIPMISGQNWSNNQGPIVGGAEIVFKN